MLKKPFSLVPLSKTVGFAAITSYVWGISETAAVWTAAAIVFSYTVCGGLFSVAYTDVVQGVMGWSGCVVMAFWFIANEDTNAPPPSIGFPGMYACAQRLLLLLLLKVLLLLLLLILLILCCTAFCIRILTCIPPSLSKCFN